MLEPSMAGAAPGSRWQLERLGYFVADVEDSRSGAPVLNRIVTLRDSWHSGADAATAPVAAAARTRSAKAGTRPPKKSRVDYRAEARVRDPELALRLVDWPATHGISDSDADLLTADRPTGDLFLAAVAAGAPGSAVARVIVNELPPALGDRPLDAVAITGPGLAALVAALESGVVTAQAARDVLAEMVDTGGDPDRIITERGLAQVSDEAALATMVDDVLAANPDKVAQYRDGRTALLGFFVGQVIRASNGNANPQVVNRLLAERLG
jgi:glutaminyl-tRNA synthetase